MRHGLRRNLYSRRTHTGRYPTSKVQSLLNQAWENDNLTLSERTKVRDLIRNFADIFATQAQDLEACTLEQFQINLIEGSAI